MTALLSASGLGLFRGERRLFGDIGFALNAGNLLLVEGANGSGKTSLLRVIAGLVEPDTGSVRWRGLDVRDHRQSYCASLMWSGHKVGCKQDLTLIENLRCERALRPIAARDQQAVFRRLDLAGLTDLPMRALSAGQQRRVALARLLLGNAELWLLDEPFTNLDAGGEALVNQLVDEHLDAGGACVMASHRGVATDRPIERLSLS
ncbi:MAG: cytochrome c biogenesis heme-transporting ATPase CcmA [Woeseiaceae bacterium]|nr:cytochrome c biogenesis heme-transporting ATPase CcmA [Woeseiaceae bacterium]